MEYLYKYPQQEFPYKKLLEENRKRSREEPEYEILDTGVFDKDEYFDVTITYAKQNARDIFIRIDVRRRLKLGQGLARMRRQKRSIPANMPSIAL